MINAEELKKLIEKEATIYQICYGDVIKRELRKECVLKENNYITCTCKKCIEAFGEKGNDCLFIFDNNCFETEAEAEFVAKYKNIIRTETLDLPTWEEFKRGDFGITFTTNKVDYSSSRSNDTFCIWHEFDGSIFCKPLTYENYIEACEVCKKLFLGEEYEQ